MFSPELGFWSLDLWKKVLCPDQASLGDLSSDTDSFFLSLSLSLSLSVSLSVCLSLPHLFLSLALRTSQFWTKQSFPVLFSRSKNPLLFFPRTGHLETLHAVTGVEFPLPESFVEFPQTYILGSARVSAGLRPRDEITWRLPGLRLFTEKWTKCEWTNNAQTADFENIPNFLCSQLCRKQIQRGLSDK